MSDINLAHFLEELDEEGRMVTIKPLGKSKITLDESVQTKIEVSFSMIDESQIIIEVLLHLRRATTTRTVKAAGTADMKNIIGAKSWQLMGGGSSAFFTQLMSMAGVFVDYTINKTGIYTTETPAKDLLRSILFIFRLPLLELSLVATAEEKEVLNFFFYE